jgi:hypothetical protein
MTLSVLAPQASLLQAVADHRSDGSEVAFELNQRVFAIGPLDRPGRPGFAVAAGGLPTAVGHLSPCFLTIALIAIWKAAAESRKGQFG